MYKELLDERVWSFSTLHSYEQCPYSFYLNKIQQSDEGEPNYYSQLGNLSHSVLEKIFKKEIRIDDAADYFIDHYDEYVSYEVSQKSMDAKFEAFMDYIANFDEVIFQRYEILGVEKKVNFKIDKYKFIGFIDLLLKDKTTGDLIIVDHKSAGHFMKKDGFTPLKAQEQNYRTYLKQMCLYAKAVFDEYGKYPAKLAWNHFLDGEVTIVDFDIKEFVKSCAWAVKTIEEIYKDEEFLGLEEKNFVLCGTLCDFRNSCEYRMEDG